MLNTTFVYFVWLFVYFLANENNHIQRVTHAACYTVKINSPVNKRYVSGSAEDLLESTILWCRKACVFRF